MAWVGVTLKPCRPLMATPEFISFSKSTKAMPGRASTMRTCKVGGSRFGVWRYRVDGVDGVY